MAKQNKTKLALGIGIGILVIGTIAFVLIKRKKRKALANQYLDTPSGSGSSSSGSSSGGSYSRRGFPLKKGSGGNEVKALQKYLNSVNNYGLVVDGKFGSKTENALKRWNGKTEVSEGYYNSTIKKFA